MQDKYLLRTQTHHIKFNHCFWVNEIINNLPHERKQKSKSKHEELDFDDYGISEEY